MRTATTIFVVLVLAAFASACSYTPPTIIKGSGNVISEPRPVSGYSEVSLSGVGTLLIAQNDAESLTIEGEDNLVAEITTRVDKGRLLIGVKQQNAILQPTRPLVYHLSVKQLNAISLSGAGNMQADSLAAPAFALEVSGVGNVNITSLNADSLRVALSGAGNATLGGKAVRQAIGISGIGSYNGENMAGEQATASTSGAGSIAVRASRTLDAHISGIGSIRYWGSPQVTQQVSGIGSVTRQGD
jgi:putative autotransporter adhesin-like protein